MDVPDIRYARAGGVAIAYQVVGAAPRTLVFSPQISDLVTPWLSRPIRSFFERLADEVRVVLFNPRGTGLSDRPRNITLETRMDDIAAVLGDIGVARASLAGISTSANACALFAASYPERVERLVLLHPYPRAIPSEGYPWGFPEDGWLDYIREVRERWGDREWLEDFGRRLGPDMADDPAELALFVLRCRLALSPASAGDWTRIGMETDIVDILGSIRVPALVIHPAFEDSQEVTHGAGPARFVAERIAGSRAIAVPHSENVFTREVVDVILDFLRDEAPVVVPESILSTVLFTDLVGSTERAAELGDRGWSDVLARHHADVRRELARYRGVEIDTAGDGFFCRFDGPARAIACARQIIDGARDLDLAVRAGVHIGECELVGEKIAGIAVVTGSRISSLAAPGEVLVSSTVKDLVAGSGFSFAERGEHELKGVPGTWRLYAVADG
jgi:class 3 adenylate cyclase